MSIVDCFNHIHFIVHAGVTDFKHSTAVPFNEKKCRQAAADLCELPRKSSTLLRWTLDLVTLNLNQTEMLKVEIFRMLPCCIR